MQKRMLIRADDLGYSRGANYGIADTVWNGIVRTVGLMPNMEEAEHGVELLKGSGICLGQHTNLCFGKPVASPEKIPSLLDENGFLKSSREYRKAWHEGYEIAKLDELVIEIEAQYHRFLELTGMKPQYFEAHAIAGKNLSLALRTVADRYALPLLDGLPEKNPILFRGTDLHIILKSSQPDYNPLKCLQEAAMKNYPGSGCAMFITHPAYLDNALMDSTSLTIPRIKETAMLTDPETRKWLTDSHISLITYNDL